MPRPAAQQQPVGPADGSADRRVGPAGGRPGGRSSAHRGATVLLVLGVVVTVTGAVSMLLDSPSSAPRPVAVALPVQEPFEMPAEVTGTPSGTAVPQLEAPLDSSDAATVGEATQASTSGLTQADLAAGLRTRTVPRSAGTRLAIVPGRAPAPGPGTRYRVRVLVESGLDVDRAAFAAFVMDTLNDPRSWGRGGRRSFARIDASASDRPDIQVVLASPATSAAMCRPLVTRGTLSCAKGSTAILTMYRWVNGTTDYGSDRTGYRRYLVNHEVGHTLGQGHVGCPGRGARAPVMMQQTKGLRGCRPNSWPYP